MRWIDVLPGQTLIYDHVRLHEVYLVYQIVSDFWEGFTVHVVDLTSGSCTNFHVDPEALVSENWQLLV